MARLLAMKRRMHGPAHAITRVRPRIGKGVNALTASLLLSLVGCTVGPDYIAPKPSMPMQYAGAGNLASASSPAVSSAFPAAAGVGAQSSSSGDWWRNFGDSTLDALISEARQSAPDVTAAEARVRVARAMRGVAGASEYPQVDAGGQYDRTHGSANVPLGVPPGGLGPGIDGNLWQAGFDASWEIDVFGGTRRTIEAADASYQAAVDERADAMLTLDAEIARNYVELRGAQRQLKVARENLSLQRDALALTESQFGAGLASRLDVLRARAQVEDTEAATPGFEASEQAAIYRIGALMGQSPELLLGRFTQAQDIPGPVADVPIGMPSDLLQRRPDIRAAERRLAAANARIGATQANLYPHFSLTGGAGLESLDASTFLEAPSHYFSIGPTISWLIFDAGKVRFSVQAEQARTDEASALYERAVLGALRDVETALVTYGRMRIRRDRLTAEAKSDGDAVEVATRLYSQGLEDFLPVLDAERSLYAAEDRLAQTDRDVALALVSLYKALGGGWQASQGRVNASAEPVASSPRTGD